jgi:hypothetical protein
MQGRNYALIGELPRTNMVKQELQYGQFCNGNADYQLSIFVGMPTATRNSPVAIDQTRDIGGDDGGTASGLPVSDQGVFCAVLPLGIPRISPGNTHKLWRRRDSLSISFETGWTMPSSLIACAVSRMRGVLFEPAALES